MTTKTKSTIAKEKLIIKNLSKMKTAKGSFKIKGWMIPNLDFNSATATGFDIIIKGAIPSEFRKLIKEYNLGVDNSFGDKSIYIEKTTFKAVYLDGITRDKFGLVKVKFLIGNCVFEIVNTGDDYKPDFNLSFNLK